MTDIERDAARYRWLRHAPNLHLDSCPRWGPPWTNVETGEQFYPTHSLAAFGVGFSGLPTLEDLLDQAMEMFPIPEPHHDPS